MAKIKIRSFIEIEEPTWRKMQSYQELANKLSHEDGCKLNTVLWDYWQEILGAINKD